MALFFFFFFLQRFHPQDIKGQCWTDEESDGENESEQFLYGIQVNRCFIISNSNFYFLLLSQ